MAEGKPMEPTYEGDQKRHPFGPEDSQRVSRISEEIFGRMQEIAAIASRVRGERLEPNTVRSSVVLPQAREGLGPDPVIYMEILNGCCVTVFSTGEVRTDCPCGITDPGSAGPTMKEGGPPVRLTAAG